MDTTGPKQWVREASLFQRLICTQDNTIGTSETVLIREVSLFQRLICILLGPQTVLIREVSLFQRLICILLGPQKLSSLERCSYTRVCLHTP